MSEQVRILLIENNPSDSRLIQELLAETNGIKFQLQWADKLARGLDMLIAETYEIVLLNLDLPDSLGLESLLLVRRHKPEVAVIILTGAEDESQGLQATLAGAQDYLVKGRLSSWLLTRAIRYAIERKRFESRLEYLATHDDLTGLPNRQLFNYTLSLALERSRRERHDHQENGMIAVMLLDLDNFKQVNDTYGHIEGDMLLRSVAARLQDCMRKTDTVARMGGDEFTLVIENIASSQDSAIIAEKVLKALSEPFSLKDTDLQTSASIGISIYPFDGTNPESLLQYADIAMYRAKQTRNCYQFFNSGEKPLIS